MARRTDDLTAVAGLSVGHATDARGRTGVTAVVFERGARTVVDVRGGASGTYDTASLALEATFGVRWAIFLSGGSLFGLDAARGVRDALRARGAGRPAFGSRHRLVPVSGAVIFDLPNVGSRLPDYAALGRAAVASAGRRPLAFGPVGAGAGATVAKYLGRAGARPGGLGSDASALGSGRSVGVLVVVNAAGAVRDPGTGTWTAVARDARGHPRPPETLATGRPLAGRGTTLAVVATDLPLSRPELARVASIVHAGLARTIVPYATSVDGDLVFAATTAPGARRRPDPWPGATADRVGRRAAEAAVVAVDRAVRRPS